MDQCSTAHRPASRGPLLNRPTAAELDGHRAVSTVDGACQHGTDMAHCFTIRLGETSPCRYGRHPTLSNLVALGQGQRPAE